VGTTRTPPKPKAAEPLRESGTRPVSSPDIERKSGAAWPRPERQSMLTSGVSTGAGLERGDKVGEYQLLTPIGAGGMGRVWVARDSGSTGRTRLVAIKTALAEQGASEQFWKVLLDEARIASRISHPNVCAIHSADRERGIVFLVLDWSDGGSLRELLDAVPEHRLETNIAVRIAARVCAGLHAVHELKDEDGQPLGVVHRDVSPQNVLISTTGQVRLTDFGVAKAKGQIHAPTQTGEVKGKLSYMAPEQVTTKDIDRRADVFAMGCVLYEATTGVRPFGGGDALATLYSLLEEPLTPPSARLAGYPPALEEIVLKALARDPKQRYQSAAEFGRALEAYLVKERTVVSDSDVGTMLKAALHETIERRAQSIDDAVDAIEGRGEPELITPVPVTPVPAAPGDDAPTLTGATSQLPAVAVTVSRKRSFVLPSAIGGAALAIVLAVFLWPRSETKPDTVATGASAVVPSVAPPEPTAITPAPVNVVITLRAEPANAQWSIDDGPPLPNPQTLEAAQGAAPRRVRATAPGYEATEQLVRFDMSREVVLSLRKEEAEPVKTTRPEPRRPVAAAPATSEPARPAPKAPGASMPAVKRPIRTLDQDNPFAPPPKSE
jgi:serine/threonine protein kinase